MSPPVVVAVLAALAAMPVAAEPPPWIDHPLCPLIEERLRDRAAGNELEIERARARLEAFQDVFALVDRLWRDEAIDRKRYLDAKHDRDVAEVDVERRAAIRDRDAAERDQYGVFCAGGGERDDAAADDARRYRAARREYDRQECRRLDRERAIARIDHAYREELLERTRDLRSGEVATKLDVLVAEWKVVDARARVDHYASRVRACQPEEDSGLETGSAR